MEVNEYAAVFAVDDVSRAGEVRRAAVAVASALGFDEERQGQVAIVVTEAVRNVAIHARGGDGECVVQVTNVGNGAAALDVLTVDKGPGMANVRECLRDGYSTAGTAGIGLGAIKRLATEFEVFSSPGQGTTLFARMWHRPGLAGAAPAPVRWDGGSVRLPKPGEEVCGDTWGIEHLDGRSLMIVADGLGHGPLAGEASGEAVRLFRDHAGLKPREIIEAIHAGLRATRGAAVSVAEFDWSARQVTFAGVGNVAAVICAPGSVKNLTSYNGTAGHELRKLQEFRYDWPADGVLVMASDGLGTQWRLDKYPGLVAKHPAVIAGVLYRDFSRRRDDVTVVAVREAQNSGGGQA